MKKILVPTDFTPISREVNNYAAELAKSIGAKLQLLHVYKELMPAVVGPEPWTITYSKLHEKKENEIGKETKRLMERYSLSVDSKLEVGFKTDSIAQTATEMNACMILIGLKSEGKRLNSTALKLMRKTLTPILLIPQGIRFHPLQNITLAVDFAETIRRTELVILANLVKQFQATLTLLHIVPKGALLAPEESMRKKHLRSVLPL